jgi:hypothetical protein
MTARHVISSIFCSLDDDPATQNFKDYELIADSIKFAALNPICPDFEYANIFPGEHYRILAGLLKVLKPTKLIDIGTYRGCSARVMLDYSVFEAIVDTFDLYDYRSFDWTVLKDEDFIFGRLTQHLSDLKDVTEFEKHRDLLESADFIMVDGPKDDQFEKTFLHLCKRLKPSEHPRWLLIDDIKFENMVHLWRAIKSPKLDISSFGHFSGTGLVNIQAGLLIE